MSYGATAFSARMFGALWILLCLSLPVGAAQSTLEAFADSAYRKHSGFEEQLETLRAYDRDSLSVEERLSYDIFEWYLEDQVFHRPIMLGDVTADAVPYEDWLRHHTTSTLTPEALFEILEDEVHRVQARVAEVFEALGIDGKTMADRMSVVHARGMAITQAQSTAVSEQMQGYVDRAAEVVRSRFGLFPVDPIVVTPVHELSSIAGYRPGSEAQGRPDQVQILPGPNGVPYYLRLTVSHHEAFPGHYVQEGVFRQLDHLPYFRRQMGSRANGEGWALYGEQLAWEAGLFNDADPLFELGFVESQLWRASRAIADVGLHAKGWSIEQTEAFLAETLGVDALKAGTMVESMVASPGAATDSTSGFLTYRRLRTRMADALGDAFDIVDYHRLVLENGPMPMEILEQLIDAAIANRT